MNRVLAVLMLVIISGFCFGCKKNGNKPISETVKPSFTGCAMRVACKAGTKERLYVSVVSDKNKEDFGIIGASGERDLGKTISFARFSLGIPLKVIWGVDGEDDMKMTHSREFDLSSYIPYADQIKSVVVMYHGDGVWKFTAYDAPGYDENKKEIIPEKQQEGILAE